MSHPWRRRMLTVLALLVTGALLVPALAYFVGTGVVGPYEGEGGFAGYLGTILGAAWRADRTALIIVLMPIGLAIIWWLALWAARRGTAGARRERARIRSAENGEISTQ